MTRTTQYIGLTNAAKKYISNARRVEKHVIGMGIGYEDVHGSIYYLDPPNGSNVEMKLVEEVQEAPWSSGPMFFTHLKYYLIKESGQEVDCGFIYSWVVDPVLSGTDQEFDEEAGTYYV